MSAKAQSRQDAEGGSVADLRAVAIPPLQLEIQNEAHKHALSALLRDFVEVQLALDEAARRRWSAVRRSRWDASELSTLEESLRELIAEVKSLAVLAPQAARVIVPTSLLQSFEQLVHLRDAAALLLVAPILPHALLHDEPWVDIRAEVLGWLEHGRACRDHEEKLRARGVAPLTRDEVEAILKEYPPEKKGAANFFSRWRERRPLRKLYPGKALPSDETLAADLALLARLQEERNFLQSIEERARHWFGALFRGSETDWTALQRALEWAGQFRVASRALAGSIASVGVGPDDVAWMAVLASGALRELDKDGALHRHLDSYAQAFQRFDRLRHRVCDLLELEGDAFWLAASRGEDAFSATERRLKDWLDHLAQVEDWSRAMRLQREIRAQGIAPWLVDLRGAGIPIAQWHEALLMVLDPPAAPKVTLTPPPLEASEVSKPFTSQASALRSGSEGQASEGNAPAETRLMRSPQAIYLARCEADLRDDLLALLGQRSPQHLRSLASELKSRWPFSKISARLLRRIESVLRATPGVEASAHDPGFFALSSEERRPPLREAWSQGASALALEYVPLEYIASLFEESAGEEGPSASHLSLVGRRLGKERLGAKARQRLLRALELLQRASAAPESKDDKPNADATVILLDDLHE